MEQLAFQPFFEGVHHPSGETAKRNEQLVTTDHCVRISNEKLPKQFLPECENLADKIYLERNIQFAYRDRRDHSVPLTYGMGRVSETLFSRESIRKRLKCAAAQIADCIIACSSDAQGFVVSMLIAVGRYRTGPCMVWLMVWRA